VFPKRKKISSVLELGRPSELKEEDFLFRFQIFEFNSKFFQKKLYLVRSRFITARIRFDISEKSSSGIRIRVQ
jgi:hypothetical protein